jgi:hypothetical protein
METITIQPDPEPRESRFHKKIISVQDMPATRSGHVLTLECDHRPMVFGPVDILNGVAFCHACAAYAAMSETPHA